MKKNSKVLIEERYLPEGFGLLKSKTTTMKNDGSIQKDIKISFCDFCGELMKEDAITLCSMCKKKLGPSCVVMHKNKKYCRQCALQKISLTKEQCMVLFGVSQHVDPQKIKKFSCMNLPYLRICISVLLKRNLIEKKGLSVLAQYVPTHKGLSLIQTCEQLFQNEEDFQYFKMRIENFMR